MKEFSKKSLAMLFAMFMLGACSNDPAGNGDGDSSDDSTAYAPKIVITIDDKGEYSKTGDDDDAIAFDDCNAKINIKGSIEGDIYINGNVSSDESHSMGIRIINSTIRGNIYVNGDVSSETGGFYINGVVTDNIYVKGNVSSTSDSGFNIRKDVKGIYVSGDVNGKNGIAVSASVTTDIHVAGSIEVSAKGISISGFFDTMTGNIYVGGNVKGGIDPGAKNTLDGSIYVGGTVDTISNEDKITGDVEQGCKDLPTFPDFPTISE